MLSSSSGPTPGQVAPQGYQPPGATLYLFHWGARPSFDYGALKLGLAGGTMTQSVDVYMATKVKTRSDPYWQHGTFTQPVSDALIKAGGVVYSFRHTTAGAPFPAPNLAASPPPVPAVHLTWTTEVYATHLSLDADVTPPTDISDLMKTAGHLAYGAWSTLFVLHPPSHCVLWNLHPPAGASRPTMMMTANGKAVEWTASSCKAVPPPGPKLLGEIVAGVALVGIVGTFFVPARFRALGDTARFVLILVAAAGAVLTLDPFSSSSSKS